MLQRRIDHLLTRPVGRPPKKPIVSYASFHYQAAGWTRARRVVAKVEWHQGELYPRIGFIVTNLTRPNKRVVKFYNGRGTAERDAKNDVNAAAEWKVMGLSSPMPVKTSRAGAWSGLRSFSLRVSPAPTGVPIDQHLSEDDHSAGDHCHPGNLGLSSGRYAVSKHRAIAANLLVGIVLPSLVAGSALVAEAAPLPGYQVGSIIRVSPNLSPFRVCTADHPGQQFGLLYPNSEIEPWVEVNPARPNNLIAGWQQDRWSNGGSRGDYSAFSTNGGATWTAVDVRGGSRCSGGPFDRESDPWLSFSPNGTAYFMTLAFDEDLPTGSFGRNAMLVNRSTNGGQSWGAPITLIQDEAGQILNDKNSLTADPNNSNFAYAVWDRLRDFTLPPNPTAMAVTRRAAGMDGVEIARERVRQLKAQGTTARQPTVVFFKGPIRFTRTTNGGQSWEPSKVIYDPGPNAQTSA